MNRFHLGIYIVILLVAGFFCEVSPEPLQTYEYEFDTQIGRTYFYYDIDVATTENATYWFNTGNITENETYLEIYWLDSENETP